MLWLLLLILLVLWFFLLIRRDKKMVLLYEKLPCDLPQWPILGHLHKFLVNDEDLMKVVDSLGKEALSKGGLVGLWRVNILYLMVNDADICEFILKNYLEKDDLVKLTWIVMGQASLFAPVPIWRPRRKLLASIFTAKKLNAFVNIFSKHSMTMVDKLKYVAGKESFSLWKYMIGYTMDSLCETTMGILVNAQDDPNKPILVAMNEIFNILVKRCSKPWLQSDFVLKILNPEIIKYKQILDGFIDELIEKKRKSAKYQAMDTTEINTKHSKSVIDMMIQTSKEEPECNNLTILEECRVLLLAGTDTTAVGISFALVMLSRHSYVQEKVYQELHEVFGDSDLPLDAEALPRLKYLEAVIKETLRLYPPAPFIFRKADKDLTLPTGVTVVKGCSILINIWALHRNPKYWGPNAEEFRPERFFDTPIKHPAAYIPFSYGPRGCVGTQYAYTSIKITIANILRRYRILPAVDPATGLILQVDEPLRVKYGVMLRDVNNYMVRLENR